MSLLNVLKLNVLLLGLLVVAVAFMESGHGLQNGLTLCAQFLCEDYKLVNHVM